MAAHERSKRRWASTCCTNRCSATSVGSGPTEVPNASASEWAGSVESTSVRLPAAAAPAAVPAAAVVLPTPPLPVNRMIRTWRTQTASAERLDALLQALQSGVDDDLLRLAAQHPDHRDADVDCEQVGDLGARAGGPKQIGALHGLEHPALDQLPRHRGVAVPVVGERVGVLDRRGFELE